MTLMGCMNFTLHSRFALPPQHVLWEKLALSTSQGDPFCSAPTWQMAFHDAFGPTRRLLIKSTTDAVIAFAEHVESENEIFLTPIEMHWRFGCLLLGKGTVKLLEETLPEIEKQHAPRPVHMLVSGIRPGGVLSRQLICSFAPSFDIYLHSSSVQGAASLKDGVDGFLSRRSANHRKKLRNQARRAADMGVRFERTSPSTNDEAEAVYARMIEVELTSWKGIQNCGMAPRAHEPRVGRPGSPRPPGPGGAAIARWQVQHLLPHMG
jgi:hypothetical protein